MGQFHHTTNIILPKVIPDTTIHRITIVFRYHIQPIHSLHPKRGSRQGKLKIHPRHRSVPVIIQPLVIDITEVHPQLPHILHPEMLGGNYVIAVPVSVTHRRRTRKTKNDKNSSLRYMNEKADRAQSWGVELDVRKNLGFIGMPNLSLVLNAAWIYSNVTFVPGEVVSEPDRPMQGQSPYVINAGLYYSSERLGLDVALLYNRIGKRIVGLGKSNSVNPDPNTLIPDSYEMPRNVLDFSVSKRIGRRVTLSCSV